MNIQVPIVRIQDGAWTSETKIRRISRGVVKRADWYAWNRTKSFCVSKINSARAVIGPSRYAAAAKMSTLNPYLVSQGFICASDVSTTAPPPATDVPNVGIPPDWYDVSCAEEV